MRLLQRTYHSNGSVIIGLWNRALLVKVLMCVPQFISYGATLHIEAARATNTQQTWRQEFLGSRSSIVERSYTRTAAAGTLLRLLQTIFENTSLWRLKRSIYLHTEFFETRIFSDSSWTYVRRRRMRAQQAMTTPDTTRSSAAATTAM